MESYSLNCIPRRDYRIQSRIQCKQIKSYKSFYKIFTNSYNILVFAFITVLI